MSFIVPFIVPALMALLSLLITIFYFPRTRKRREPAAPSFQEVPITIQQQFDPQVVVVEAGSLIKLRFHRAGDDDASSEIFIDERGLDRVLPPRATTTIDLLENEAGHLTFRGKEKTLRGVIVVVAKG